MIDKLLNQEVQKFIQEHVDDDPVSLILQSDKYPHMPMVEIANQIKARQRLRKKLPEWTNNPEIIFPVALSQEQSSSEITAFFKTQIISGNIIADLTGGSGVDTYYLSKAFNQIYYVEPNKELYYLAQHNLSILGASNVKFFNEKAEEFLTKDLKVDFVYLDPDRRGNNNRKLYFLSDCEPDVVQLLQFIWLQTSSVLIKTSPMLDITESIRSFGAVEKIYIVAVENEVKEVLYVLKKDFEEGIKVHTINILNNVSFQRFIFDYDAEKVLEPYFSDVKKYLYEPNAAILKAGAFKSITKQFEVLKLHPNSHLYTSDKLINNFPGRAFKVESVKPYKKKQLVEMLPDKKANITVRNFTESVDLIRKKTGIKDGGNIYLFFTTDLHEKAIVIFCKKPLSA